MLKSAEGLFLLRLYGMPGGFFCCDLLRSFTMYKVLCSFKELHPDNRNERCLFSVCGSHCLGSDGSPNGCEDVPPQGQATPSNAGTKRGAQGMAGAGFVPVLRGAVGGHAALPQPLGMETDFI